MPGPKRTRVLAGLFIASLLVILSYRATAQDSAEVDFFGQETARYSGGVLTVEIKGADPGWAGVVTARVSDIDVGRASVEGNYDGSQFSIDLACKGDAPCAARRGHYVGLQLQGNGPPNWDDSGVTVQCRMRSQCEAFLNALRASGRPPGPPPEPTRAVQSQPAARTNPPTQARANPASPSSSSSSAAAGAPDTAFHDMADEIRRRNGGTTTLDDLAKKTKPTPTPPRPAAQPTYVAFAQSAGFDANSQYGYARNKDLNSAIGQANSLCVSNAQTSCGDEGYCMLQPGLYGAWVSDRKYLGAKAFACNLKTEEEAVNRALAWCGSDQCQLLWTGAGN